MASERERDIEFGRLVEAVNTLQREAAQKRVDDQGVYKSIFDKLDELQGDMHRLRGAKSIAAFLVTALIGIGAAVAEWLRIGLETHK